jgi:uncharacterized protein YdeI (YjbR/CyaY-like superfamily)
MVTRDPRVDAYIEQAPDFARPVLTELRARMHAACPDVVETIKWRVPSFEHGGLLGGMAAFKAYCMFGFWKDPLLREDADGAAVLEALGRVTKVGELPSRRAFGKVVQRAMELNAAGTVVPRKPKAAKAKVAMHPELARALAAKPAAKKRFAAFAPGQQREYIEWIADAKKDDTRARRIEQAVEWIAEGKKRNWKYETC